MLEYLRNAADKPAAKILMGLLIFSFVGWGAADWILSGGGSDSIIMEVGDAEISAPGFANLRSAEMAKLSRDEQRALYANPARGAKFTTDLLTRVANESMIAQHADDLGIIVTDKRIATEIARTPEFFENGKFSQGLFDQVLFASGMNDEMFAAQMRRQIAQTMILGPVGVPVTVPEFAVTAAFNARYASRDIEYSRFAFADYNVGEPTDEQLREYYAKNPKILPETRTVSYVLMPADLSKPDEYDAAYVKMQRAEDAIIGGDALVDAAAANGAKFAAIPAFVRGAKLSDSVMTDEIIARVFAMDEGLESEIIETEKGFLILRVEKINPEHAAEFDSVKKDLVAGWRKSEQKKQAYLAANETLSDKKDLRGSATVTRASGAAADVLVAAFKQDVGAAAIAESADAFYVVKVLGETAPKADAARRSAVAKELATMSLRQMAEDYNAFLQRNYPVKINQKTFERMFGN